MTRYPLLAALLAALLLAPAVAGAQTKKDSKDVLPKALKKIWFGMPLETFGEVVPLRDLSEEETSMDFRRVFADKDPDWKIDGLDYVVYYFDGEGTEPLYEIILNFSSEAARDAAAADWFGTPNAEDGEWWHPEHEAFAWRAWPFQTKLVVAAVLPGSEWEGQWD